MSDIFPAAEALDRWVTECTQPGAVPASTVEPELATLAAALVTLAAETRPDPLFAMRLGAQLHTRAVARRRVRMYWAWGIAVGAILLALLLSAPQIQASLVEIWQIGVVRIFVGPPTNTPTPDPTPAPGMASPVVSGTPQPTLAPNAPPIPTLLPSLLDLAGATTLEDARARVEFPLRLPTYPTDLGAPQYVFVQDLEGAAVIVVWTNPSRPSEISLSLHALTSPLIATKGDVTTLAETQVNQQPAVWVEGEHLLVVTHSGKESYTMRRLVGGNVLVWTVGTITYRLETKLSMEEAVRIAESLQ